MHNKSHMPGSYGSLLLLYPFIFNLFTDTFISEVNVWRFIACYKFCHNKDGFVYNI
jgi:hypothetical protein